MCPGTLNGEFDPTKHVFRNYRYEEIRRDLHAALDLMHSLNPQLRFLLTVSPVPLTATASSQHVLVATVQAKSTLRAAAGDIAADRGDTDYFPSYEMISSFPFKAKFYDENMRTVSRSGVDFVMRSFFKAIHAHDLPDESETQEITTNTPAVIMDDLICEEIGLDVFARSR
jgi:hypothetical protein